jgi:hypothetical protein
MDSVFRALHFQNHDKLLNKTTAKITVHVHLIIFIPPEATLTWIICINLTC